MDKRRYKKSDKDVRSALWLAYDKKDVYSGDLLRYREMEVDHIVPQEIFKNEEKKLEVLKALGLDSNFQKDSLENFVPTRRGTNSSKGASVDPILIKNKNNIEVVSKADIDVKQIEKGKDLIEKGERKAQAVLNIIKETIESEPLAKIDYVSIVDTDSLQDVDTIDKSVLVAIAVYINNKARVIDNFVYEI